MHPNEWREKILNTVADCSEEGKEAAEYLRAHNTHIGIRRARKSVGAFWIFTRSIYLNSAHYSPESAIVNPGAWALLIHEARHLQQGWRIAYSIYGELDAWQVQFRVLKKLTGATLRPALEELLTLPLEMERSNLRRARSLMTQFAGVMYGAYLYPLYPLDMEIAYWAGLKP